MNQLVFVLVQLLFCFCALAAKKGDYWYKVDSEKKEKVQKNSDPYPYDSVEKGAPNKKFSKVGFWSLKPKVGLSAGFHADKEVLENDKTNRWLFNSALYFRNRPWHRFTINALILQNNSAFVGGEWQYTPSRTAHRNYYGFGISHLLVSEKEFRNLVELKNYHLTLSAGREFLLRSQHAWFVELKGFLGPENHALQLSAGYIIPF